MRKLKKVGQFTLVAGAEDSFGFDQYDFNHLVFVRTGAFTADEVINVSVKDSVKMVVLVNNIALSLFEALTDLKGGFTGNEKHSAVVDLGSIVMTDLEKVEITMRNKHASNSVSVAVYAVQNDVVPDKFLKYTTTTDFNESHPNLKDAYLVGVNAEDTCSNANFEVRSEMETLFFDRVGAEAMTQLEGKVENDPAVNLVQIHESDDITENITIQVTDTDAGDLLLIVEEQLSEKRVARSTIKNSSKVTSRIESLEGRSPSRARALRRTGKIVKSGDMRAVLRTLNV